MVDLHSLRDGLGWSPTAGRADARPTFSFDSVLSNATIERSALNEATGVRFRSDPASTSHSEFASVGNEKNGVFFR